MSLSRRKLHRLFAKAQAAHQRGQLEIALKGYARIFGQSPELNAFLGRIDDQLVAGTEQSVGTSLRGLLGRIDEIYGAALHYSAIASRQLYASSRETGHLSPEQLQQIDGAAERLMGLSIIVSPTNPAALYNFAMSRQMKGDIVGARDLYRAAAKYGPMDAHTWAKLGDCLLDLGDEANALAAWSRAQAFPPKSDDTAYNLSFLYLVLGDFARGLALHESRWQCPDFVHANGRAALTAPVLTKGEDVARRRVLVRHEQGNGDQIQFGRFVRQLLDAGAEVIVECLPGLVRLFRLAFPSLEVIGLGEDVPAHEVQVPFMSLAWHFVSVEADIPAPLTVPEIPVIGKLAATRAQLRSMPGLKVGISWAGSEKHTGDRKRSAPPEFLDALAHAAGVTFVNLQVGARSEEFARLGDHRLNPVRALRDFTDTGALMQGLDVVLSVDTAVAHLAGSVGVETLVALPYNAEWRWQRGRPDSPWYPSAQLWRQASPNDWVELGERMRMYLEGAARLRQAAA